MSTICKDCGVQGKGVHHCEQYYNQTHSIAEYQRIEEELQAKVEKLETERNLAWDKGYAQGRDDAIANAEDIAFASTAAGYEAELVPDADNS